MSSAHMRLIFILIMNISCISGVYCSAHTTSVIPFSFDQLYPTSMTTRALNAVRFAWSLAQDLNDNQYDADNVRHVWLEVYGACDQLTRQQKTERSCMDAGVASVPLADDMKEYIKHIWQLTCNAYDHIAIVDVSLGQFLAHMRIACDQLMVQL